MQRSALTSEGDVEKAQKQTGARKGRVLGTILGIGGRVGGKGVQDAADPFFGSLKTPAFARELVPLNRLHRPSYTSLLSA